MPMKYILFFGIRIKVVCLIGAATLLATIFVQTSLATTINVDNFYMECPTLSLMASRLGDQCYASSKDYTRFFASSLEEHGAYIQAGMPNSHFGIGCTIDNKKNYHISEFILPLFQTITRFLINFRYQLLIFREMLAAYLRDVRLNIMRFAR
jgi:hypothetical protein